MELHALKKELQDFFTDGLLSSWVWTLQCRRFTRDESLGVPS